VQEMVQEGGSWNVPWAPFLLRTNTAAFVHSMLNIEGVELLDNSVACDVHQCGSF